MSDMNEEIEIEGGFLDEAGIDANDIPDDPFGFGNDYWPIFVLEVGKPSVTKNKDKIGMMVKFAVDHPKYQESFVAKTGLGNGMWMQLPVPVDLRSRIPWDPNGEKEQKALYSLKELYKALGFKADEYGSVNAQKMIGRRALAKIKVNMSDSGFWEFRLNGMRAIPEGSDAGMGEFSQPATTKTPEQLLEEELNAS